MAREGPAGIDINFPPLYFTEAGSQLQGQAIHTMSVPNLIPSDSWCQRVVHTKYRPLPILAALDESICLNSLSNHLANPECGREQHQESAGEGRTFMQVGLAVAAAAGIH